MKLGLSPGTAHTKQKLVLLLEFSAGHTTLNKFKQIRAFMPNLAGTAH